MLFGQGGCILAMVVVFGLKWLYLGKSCYNREKCLYSGIVFVIGQK